MGGTFLAFALFLGFQAASTQSPAASRPDLCTVEGTIIAADTGQPLRKAWVSLHKAEGRGDAQGAGSDASGHFVIKNVEPGRYRLSAWHAGYVNQAYGQRGQESSGTTLSLAPGQAVHEISIRLTRAAVISGHVYDEDGDPVVGAQVSAMRYGYLEGKKQLMPRGFGQTNDLGEYRIYGLAPGSYFLSASHNSNNFQFGGGGGGPGYPPTYYPNASDAADVTPVSVRGGDDYPGVDFNLQPTRAVTVSGRAFNAVTGQPGVRTNIFLAPRRSLEEGMFTLQFQTYVQDPQGAFKLENVVPGSYYLIGMTQVEGKQYTSRLPLEVGDADLTGVNLTISQGITLTGRVVGLSKSEVAGINVLLRPRQRGMFFGTGTTSLKSDGRFDVTNLSDGSYRVDVWQLPEDAYVKEIRLGDESVLTSGVEITGGQNPGNLEIVISPNGGRLDGVVMKENQTFSGASVVLIPNDPALRKEDRFYKLASSDQNGNFTLQGIRPGEYKAYAWERIEQGAYQDPNFMSRYENEGKAVEIKEGNQAAIQLSLSSTSPSE
ncbi:MAG: carboxypeptidase regulatory-like domain-containing protein [Deltaproteobacteria bacterium]